MGRCGLLDRLAKRRQLPSGIDVAEAALEAPADGHVYRVEHLDQATERTAVAVEGFECTFQRGSTIGGLCRLESPVAGSRDRRLVLVESVQESIEESWLDEGDVAGGDDDPRRVDRREATLDAGERPTIRFLVGHEGDGHSRWQRVLEVSDLGPPAADHDSIDRLSHPIDDPGEQRPPLERRERLVALAESPRESAGEDDAGGAGRRSLCRPPRSTRLL